MRYSMSACLAMVVLTLVLGTGCTNTKRLQEENASLKSRVAELEQLSRDYSDKLASIEQLSAQERADLENEMAQMRRELDRQLQQQIAENQVLIQKLNSLTIITLGEAALFGSGIADLTRAGAATIRDMALALEQYPGYHIRIEGHTDSMPISDDLKATYASNWELSAARATSVVRYMIYGLGIAPERLSAVGYAQYRPVADNMTKEGRAKNRRIRVVLFKEM